MIVVDATVWVDKLRGLLPEEISETIRIEGCVSPPHVDFEVGSALIRLERRGELGPGQARELVEAFSSHPVERVNQPGDAVHAVEMLDNSTYADAWYLALAKRMDCPILTTDAGMKAAARFHGVPVI
jgi:predicted nucleic acid-binding protein